MLIDRSETGADKTRILFTYPTLLRDGGGTLAFQNQVRFFAKLGCEVFTFYFEGDDSVELPGQKERARAQTKPGFLAKYVPSLALFRQFQDIRRRFEPNVVHIHSFSVQFFILAIFALLCKRSQVKIINVVHSAEYNCLRTVHTYADTLAPCAGAPGLKCLRHACESWLSFVPKILFHHLRNAVLKLTVNKFVAPSRFMFQQLEAAAFQNVVHIPLLFSHVVADESAVARPRPTQAPPSLLFVGHLSWHKGPQFLPAIMAEVSQRAPNVRLIIVGDGPLRCEVERQARKLGVQHMIRFVGAVANDEAQAYLRDAVLVILPTLFENLSLAIYEALAHGVPVLTTNHGGNADLVENGYSGYFIQLDQPKKTASLICELLNNPEARYHLSRNARASIARYSETALADRYLQLL